MKYAEFNIENNRIEFIPDGIIQLEELVELSLYNNPIKVVSEELFQMRNKIQIEGFEDFLCPKELREKYLEYLNS